MKFLCDQMLGTLAKWLRVYGFDTFFANSILEDKDLIEIAKKEQRALITRDKTLAQVARRENLKVFEIKSTDIDEQLKQVLRDINVDEKQFFSRCLLCNSPISLIDKNKVKDKVPKLVYKNNQKFWYCSKCNKIYWKGSHHDNMLKKIKSMD